MCKLLTIFLVFPIIYDIIGDEQLRKCGTKSLNESALQWDRGNRSLSRAKIANNNRGRRVEGGLEDEPQLEIPIKFIVFTNADGDGTITPTQAQHQIDRLNRGFNGSDGDDSPFAVDTRLSFRLESLQIVHDNTFFRIYESAWIEGRMKRRYALHTDR
jgi:hypothetical protein